MKVAIFNGSSRHHSNSELISGELRLIFERLGYDTVVLNASDMTGCRPCNQCGFCSSVGSCIYERDTIGQHHIKHIWASDIWVIVTPVYCFSMSPPTLTLLSRFYSYGPEVLQGKVVSSVIVSGSSGRYGGKSLVNESFKRYFEYTGANYTNKPIGITTNDTVLEDLHKLTPRLRLFCKDLIRRAKNAENSTKD